MQKTTELIASDQDEREAIRGSSPEKWLALIGFVVVTVSAVALLFPK